MPVNEKRPMCMKRDVQKRPMYMKRDLEKSRLIHVTRIKLTFEKLYACSQGRELMCSPRSQAGDGARH